MGTFFKESFLCYTYLLALVSVASSDRKACNSMRWCNECITKYEDCAWCKDTDFQSTRCDLLEELQNANCASIEYSNNTLTIIKNDVLQDGDMVTDPVQIQPQKIKMALRPGRLQSIRMAYRSSLNLPLDIYFLLDSTKTMQKKLQAIGDLTQSLIDTLKAEFTNNIYVGFGSFVDKPLQPMTITTPERLENPCYVFAYRCDRTYGYIHRHRLNPNIDAFVKSIRASNISANLDPAEGGLDAVMQAAVCPDIIGWRNNSRHLMVYVSDGPFHFAGDAKLAGIDRPNDAKCHMDKHVWNNETYIYTHSTVMDYPSYSGLGKVLDMNHINIIFMVDENVTHLYEGLSAAIKQAETVIMTESGIEDAVDTIISYYTKLSKRLEIRGDNIPPELEVNVSSNCLSGEDRTWNIATESAYCTELDIGIPVYFNISVALNACAINATSSKSRTFKLIPVGLQEYLEIDVEYLFGCNCTVSEESRTVCTAVDCECGPGLDSEYCHFDCVTGHYSNRYNTHCQRYKDSDILCEKHGTCSCGVCSCLPNYGGKYCECDRSMCIMTENALPCSGAKQGECNCNYCECKGGYYGDFCQCRPVTHCFGKNGLECSGHGTCECGKCFCESYYTGDTCEQYSYKNSWENQYKTREEKNSNLLIALATPHGVLIFGLLVIIIWKVTVTIYDSIQYRKWKPKGDGDADVFTELSNAPATEHCERHPMATLK